MEVYLQELNNKLYNTSDEQSVVDFFNKIKDLFTFINLLFQFNISRVDDDIYKKVNDNVVVFPIKMDELTMVLGIYNKAFTPDIYAILFNIISCERLQELFNISNIPDALLIDVEIGSIDINSIESDYNELKEYIKQYAYILLKNDNSIVEIIPLDDGLDDGLDEAIRLNMETAAM